jgi:3-isopropylmalate dehydrogenase
MLRSVALCLEHALGLANLARLVTRAIAAAAAVAVTPDLGGSATTDDFTEAVLVSLSKEEAWSATS